MEPDDYKVKILKLASQQSGLPELILDNNDIAPLEYFRELYESKWLDGNELPKDHLPSGFQNLVITRLGREGLKTLMKEWKRLSSRDKVLRVTVWIHWFLVAIGFVISLIALHQFFN